MTRTEGSSTEPHRFLRGRSPWVTVFGAILLLIGVSTSIEFAFDGDGFSRPRRGGAPVLAFVGVGVLIGSTVVPRIKDVAAVVVDQNGLTLGERVLRNGRTVQERFYRWDDLASIRLWQTSVQLGRRRVRRIDLQLASAEGGRWHREHVESFSLPTSWLMAAIEDMAPTGLVEVFDRERLDSSARYDWVAGADHRGEMLLALWGTPLIAMAGWGVPYWSQQSPPDKSLIAALIAFGLCGIAICAFLLERAFEGHGDPAYGVTAHELHVFEDERIKRVDLQEFVKVEMTTRWGKPARLILTDRWNRRHVEVLMSIGPRQRRELLHRLQAVVAAQQRS